MAHLLNLPLEIRSQIYSYLIDWDNTVTFGSEPLYPKIHKISPAILRTNKQISHEAGMTFYRENPLQLWIEIDYDKQQLIDITFDAALTALSDEALPRAWECLVTVYVSYGMSESEFYVGRLTLLEVQEKYPSLCGAPEGQGIQEGWLKWFSSDEWYIKALFAPASRRSIACNAGTKRGRSLRYPVWKAGRVISGDAFVRYLKRLLPAKEPCLENPQNE